MTAALAILHLAILAQQPPPVFRVATRLVQVNVVVHDHHGQPVADLKKDDFTITERGKPQAISFFEVVAADKPAAPLKALPPHVFTNVVTRQAGVPTNVTVILVDLLNTGLVDQHYARKALVNFLSQIQPQDRIALYTLGHRSLTLLHDYTTDASSLVDQLRKTRGEIPSQLDASTVNTDSQEALRALGLDELADMNQIEADFFTANRVVQTLSSLEAIAQHLTGVPGRKNLIWLSGGFPLTMGFDEMPSIGSTRDQRTFTVEMDAAMRALNNAGVAVYPVDARGLMVMPGFSADTRAAPSPRSIGAGLRAMHTPIETMQEIAERTGGRAAYNTNDLASAVRRAIDDARVTYIVGYYPADEAQDGRFRDIKVKVNRPNLDVRYRKGYFAMRPLDTSDKTRKTEMRAAVWSPLESTAIGLTARVDLVDTPQPETVRVSLQIDPTMLSFTKEGDRWKAELDVVYVQKTESGPGPGDGIADRLSLALSEATYADVMKNGLIRERTFPRQPRTVTVRVVVRDAATGSTGSITVPFSQLEPGR
jgi:VWFA-related protein